MSDRRNDDVDALPEDLADNPDSPPAGRDGDEVDPSGTAGGSDGVVKNQAGDGQ